MALDLPTLGGTPSCSADETYCVLDARTPTWDARGFRAFSIIVATVYPVNRYGGRYRSGYILSSKSRFLLSNSSSVKIPVSRSSASRRIWSGMSPTAG